MAHKQKQDLRNIFDLLDKLCRKFSPDRHKDVLKTVTSTIAESGNFLSGLQFDESIIVSKIKNHLAVKNENNLAVFLNLYQELSNITDAKFRSSILTLMLYLSDMESKLPNTGRHESSAETVFSLPVRNRQIEPSSSMQEVCNRIGMGASRVSEIWIENYFHYDSCKFFFPQSASTSSVNSDNLKLVTFRRKFPSSTSSDSVLAGQTPDSDSSQLSYSQNEELVQEAIYALTGKSGKFLKKDVTGDFKPDIKARNLNSQDAVSLLRLAEIGQLHNKIQKFTDSNSEFFLCGLFGQGLISQIENELVQFYGLIAQMQDNVSFWEILT